MGLYLIPNGAAPTTAAQLLSDTGTAIKTLLQVKSALTSQRPKIVEWGISFGGSALATPVQCELLTTGTVNATVTEHLASGIKLVKGQGISITDDNPFAFGAAGDETGWQGTGVSAGEGTITTTEVYDFQNILPTNQYVKQWPLGREPDFDPADFLRVRVTAAANVNVYTYVVIEI